MATLEAIDRFPDGFASPLLIEGLFTALKTTLPVNANTAPIQTLSLKLLFRPKQSPDAWREYLLVSKAGSGKSISYLLPLLQDLKKFQPR